MYPMPMPRKTEQHTTNLVLTPSRFYAIADMMRHTRTEELSAFMDLLGKSLDQVEGDMQKLAQANDALVQQANQMTRRRSNPFTRDEDEGDQTDPLARLKHSMSGDNFIHVIFGVVDSILKSYHLLLQVGQMLKPMAVAMPPNMRKADMPSSFEEIQMLTFLIQMNEGAISQFVNATMMAEVAPELVIELGKRTVGLLDQYYARLLHRHSVEGIEIHGDPVTTDVALSIFENVDANGEIQDGKNINEVSAYSLRKATLIADSIKVGLIGQFIKQPDRLIEFLTLHLLALWDFAKDMSGITKENAAKLRKLADRMGDTPRHMSDTDFQRALDSIQDLDPQHIVFKEKTGLLTAEERKELEFRNETLRVVAATLANENISTKDLVNYILTRKKELRDYHLEQNSFYVCKLSAGNPFGGEAPGALSVVPGTKPTVVLSEVIGSGFQEVVDFLGNVKDGAKWHDLFVATSPSKKADKSNVLLVGPQGCGKTEVLRAVASDRNSIGVFAQSSDFLTCWKGEAEKNPKRLFEGGLKLQKESGKQVFFLIDEIDTILNSDTGHNAFGGTNLATEFQVLMDGITTYPNLALWGATNHPERISMPLIRRFAKVIIVGELDQKDRIRLLQQFVGYLPVSDTVTDDVWAAAALKLEGAVGDVVRKVADHLWREKMSRFVALHPLEAEKLAAILHTAGQKFNVAEFTEQKRKAFQDDLRPFVQVQPDDLMASIDHHLNNIAIRSEIQTAVATYQNARQFLHGINAR